MISGHAFKWLKRRCFVIWLSQLLALPALTNFALTVPYFTFEEAVMILFGPTLRPELISPRI
jgi:hypothetical protein